MSFSTSRKLEAYRRDFQNLTLGQALDEGAKRRWTDPRGTLRRRFTTGVSQGKMAIQTLAPIVKPELSGLPVATLRDLVVVREVTPEHVEDAVERWMPVVSTATINSRINALSVMGLNVEGLRVALPSRLKWWLTPDDQAKVRATYGDHPDADIRLMADYVDWAAHTGLRVEESLRLRRSDFAEVVKRDGTRIVVVTVPGTKTAESQATLPLTEAAAALYYKRLPPGSPHDAIMFPTTYRSLAASWQHARALVGAHDDPLATLKALRRSAARHLTTNGMPLDILRQYLRHNDVETTMGYLTLTGGYSVEEFSKWL